MTSTMKLTKVGRVVIQTASTWAVSFDTLLTAYQSIGEQMPLLSRYEGMFGNDSHLEDVLVRIYANILEFHSKTLRFFNRPGQKRFFLPTVILICILHSPFLSFDGDSQS